MKAFAERTSGDDEVKWTREDIGDAALLHREVWSVEVKGGQSPMVQHGSEEVRALRIVHQGQLGFSTSRTQGWDELKRMAYEAARNGPDTRLDEPDLNTVRSFTHGPTWQPGYLRHMTEGAQTLYERLASFADDFRPSVSVAYHATRKALSNSRGGSASWEQGYWEITAGGRRVSGTDFHGLNETRLRADAMPDIAELGKSLAERFQWGEKILTVESGSYPVILLAPIVMSLFTSVLARLSGPALMAGNSPWEDRKDQAVLSPLLTLWSDPMTPDGPRTGPFDDEGTPTAVRPLIEQGVLRNFVLDRETAGRLAVEPPGMGYRPALNALPTSLPSNLVIAPGSLSLADLINSFPRVLILQGWIGGRPTNPLRGDISGNASDLYYAEDGAIVGRVKNAVVSLNAFDVLSHQLRAVGSDSRWVPQGMMQAAPGKLVPLLIDGVSVNVRK